MPSFMMNSKEIVFAIAKSHFSAKEFDWIHDKCDVNSSNFVARKFYLSFSGCSRHLGQEPLRPEPEELAKLEHHYPNFGKTLWPKDEIGRILLMLSLPTELNKKHLSSLFETADYRELIALYKGLYFLENAKDFASQAREGLRTNMAGVFDAIALHNPFPYKYLTKEAWNQMVLKAMFMDRPIYKIYRLEERKNLELALIFLDYAHERWSAHRNVSPELWRFLGGHIDGRFFEDAKVTILSRSSLERSAAIKAVLESEYIEGIQWLKEEGVEMEALPTWDEIGISNEKNKA